MEQRVGVIGLGKMGLAMAERFIETGIQVVGTDVTPACREAAAKAGVDVRDGADAVFAAAPVVLLSLPTAADVRTVVAGLEGRKGQDLYVVDTTSSDPVVTRELSAKLKSSRVHFIDAPVSGGFFGARAGTLGIMAGGEEADLEHVRPVLDRIGGKISHMGPSGAGHATKLLNNLLGAANLAVAAEIVRLGEQQGLDPATLIAALNSGAAKNGATEVNYPRWILTRSFDSGFTMKLMRKDVGLADQLVSKSDVPLDLLSTVGRIWAESKAGAADDADFNALTHVHPRPGAPKAA